MSQQSTRKSKSKNSSNFIPVKSKKSLQTVTFKAKVERQCRKTKYRYLEQ